MITPCRAAVLGHPIAHSLSPALHRAAYEWAGLNWRYDACDVTEDSLADFVAACGPEWAGLSLTMPLKRAIIPLLDEVSPLAASVDAVNTVVFRDGIALGDNTDIPGMVSAISAVQRSPLSTACILGGGATARSALVAIARLGAREVVLGDELQHLPLRDRRGSLGEDAQHFERAILHHHLEGAGDQEMAQFMKEHHQGDDEQEGGNAQRRPRHQPTDEIHQMRHVPTL